MDAPFSDKTERHFISSRDINNALRKEEYEFQKALTFNQNTIMKERKYENALHYIMGVLINKRSLEADDIEMLQNFIGGILIENDEPQKQVIRG